MKSENDIWNYAITMNDMINCASRCSPRIRAYLSKKFFAVCGSALVLSSVLWSLPAAADLKLCNTTASRVGVAIGYKDDNGWATEGWWNIASHTCETLLKGDLNARFYYIHAIDYDRGGEWSGNSLMCTKNKSFTIRGVDRCVERGFKQTKFFEIDTTEQSDWTVRLSDPNDAKSK